MSLIHSHTSTIQIVRACVHSDVRVFILLGVFCAGWLAGWLCFFSLYLVIFVLFFSSALYVRVLFVDVAHCLLFVMFNPSDIPNAYNSNCTRTSRECYSYMNVYDVSLSNSKQRVCPVLCLSLTFSLL